MNAEWNALAFQFVASICWAIGAILDGLNHVVDALYFAAAVAWFLSNCCSAYLLYRRPSGTLVRWSSVC